jgi:solute carrier family 25 S-adenosylmethionine transporter 26
MPRLSLLLVSAFLASASARAVFASKPVQRQSELVAEKKTGNWKSEMLFHERLLAGAASRGTAQTILHPIDVIRTRLQAKGVAMKWSIDTFAKGLAPQAILAMPAGALQFAAFEWSKAQCAAAGFKSDFADLFCGAMGALAASVIRVPQEVLKQRVQADIYPNAVKGFQMLMSTEGPKGLYKGYFATISRDIPWNALTFMFFAQAKTAFKKLTGDSPSTEQNLVLGALSGMTAAVIMTPVDVVKTRLMTGGASGGIVGTFQAILKDEGAATLMKGVVPRVAFLAPLAAMTLALYEAYARQLVGARLGVAPSSL